MLGADTWICIYRRQYIAAGLNFLGMAADVYRIAKSALAAGRAARAAEALNDLQRGVQVGEELSIMDEAATAGRARATGALYEIEPGRFVDLEGAGIPIRSLSPTRIRVSGQGVDVVQRHLSRFTKANGQPFGGNTVMLNRLRRIAAGELKATQVDLNFYAHELREFTRLRKMGYAMGAAPAAVYEKAHYAALAEYGIPFQGHGQRLYTEFALEMLLK
jgi:hypothetical protein